LKQSDGSVRIVLDKKSSKLREQFMYKQLLYIFLLSIFIIGCTSEPEEPEPIENELPPPPPPPTPEEIAGKIINDLQLNSPVPPPGTDIPIAMLTALKTTISNEKARLSATEDGKMALAIVSQKVDSKVRQCFNSESWALVLALSDVHEVLNPGSKKFDSERIRSIAELSRPIIVIKGIINDGVTDRPLALLEITLPLEGRTVTESMKKGDLLHQVRFVELIGNNQGIVFEYVQTGDTFDVLTKNASR
jgi:hypothetical protein